MLLRKKEEIESWLNKYNIKDYKLIEDEKYSYVVNVNSCVHLFKKKLKNIKVKFNEINGYFNCNMNELKSLEGCPNIVNGSFYCSRNKLKTLKHCPKIIKGEFYCCNNLLIIEGLKYLPKEIKNNIIQLECNEKLGEFQHIEYFEELKEKIEEILKIKEEKENLLKTINKEELKEMKGKNKI